MSAIGAKADVYNITKLSDAFGDEVTIAKNDEIYQIPAKAVAL